MYYEWHFGGRTAENKKWRGIHGQYIHCHAKVKLRVSAVCFLALLWVFAPWLEKEVPDNLRALLLMWVFKVHSGDFILPPHQGWTVFHLKHTDVLTALEEAVSMTGISFLLELDLSGLSGFQLFTRLFITHFPLPPDHVSSRGSLDLLVCGLLFEMDCSYLSLFTLMKYCHWFKIAQSFVNLR